MIAFNVKSRTFLGETKTHHTSWGYSIVDQLVLKTCTVINMFDMIWTSRSTNKNSDCYYYHPPRTIPPIDIPGASLLQYPSFWPTNLGHNPSWSPNSGEKLWWNQKISPILEDVKIKPWFGWFGGIDSLLIWFSMGDFLDLTHWLVERSNEIWTNIKTYLCFEAVNMYVRYESFACANVRDEKEPNRKNPELDLQVWHKISEPRKKPLLLSIILVGW